MNPEIVDFSMVALIVMIVVMGLKIWLLSFLKYMGNRIDSPILRANSFELKARIDIRAGLWPAWWTLGVQKPWPANGEIDIMEYYNGKILANIACLGSSNQTEWHSKTQPVDSQWASQFHVWRMDWDENSISLYSSFCSSGVIIDSPINLMLQAFD